MVPRWNFNRRKKWLEGTGTKKGICTKVFVKQAKKPNSGLRKVAHVRLSNGREVLTYIPGIGHNLQVHSVVMVRGGRHKDTLGCNYTCIRGLYDLLPVAGRLSSRSKYGAPKPEKQNKWERYQYLTTSIDRRLHFYRTGEELGPNDPVPLKIPYVVKKHPPVTYSHKKRPYQRR